MHQFSFASYDSHPLDRIDYHLDEKSYKISSIRTFFLVWVFVRTVIYTDFTRRPIAVSGTMTDDVSCGFKWGGDGAVSTLV